MILVVVLSLLVSTAGCSISIRKEDEETRKQKKSEKTETSVFTDVQFFEQAPQ
jgi:hypothetical protein